MAVSEPVAVAGKYLTFGLGGEWYGLEILRVQEIVGLLPVTRVPRMPASIAGVVNLRGRVIPVVDLRIAFGLPASEMHERTCIVVVHFVRADGRSSVMGIIVDEVSDVVALSDSQIEETPEFGVEADVSFVRAVGRLEDRVVLLLDIDRALTTQDFEAVSLAADQAGTDDADAGK
jgi:purine-binding chemotaxis protein CheW